MDDNSIGKAVATLNRLHKELVDKLVQQYETTKESTEKDLEVLPDWLKDGIKERLEKDPAFILTSLSGFVFSATEAVKLAQHFNSRREWAEFLDKPDFSSLGGVSQKHSEQTFQLMLSVANDIVTRNCPEIQIATTDQMPPRNSHLKIVRD